MEIISFVNQSAFYFGAIFVALSCLFYTHIHKNMEKPQTIIFIMALWVTILTSLCNMVAIYAEPFCTQYRAAQKALYVSNYLYFILHNLLAMFLCYYAFFATQTFTGMKTKAQIIYIIPCLISEIFMLTNPINNWSWYYDEAYHFHRNWAESSVYIAGAFYYVIAVYYLMFRWYAATRKRKLMIFVSFLMTAVGIAIQFFVPRLEVELFFEAINFMGVMLSVEYDDDRVDMITRMYNRDAFVQDARYYFDIHTGFYAILLKITNYDAYQKMPDAYDINEVAEMTATSIRRVFPYSTCYRVAPNCFMMLALNKDEMFAEGIANKVDQLIKDGLGMPKKDERIMGMVLFVKVPEEVSTVRDLLLMCEMDFKDVTSYGIIKGGELHELFDRAGIENAMRRGIEEHNFEVFYQMVYTTKDRKVHSAEALVRLNDPEMGQLLPKVFIPAAERNGMIDIIGDFVLRQVCSFIKSGIADELGIRYINVNLSVLQCMQPHFVESVTAIVREADVEPSRINFEITESVAAEDYKYLNNVMKACRKFGFKFSMEGYGSGYSNMNTVFSLDFDEIKLDKTMLWEADKSEHGSIIMENSVRMIHEMNLPVVAVGVESEEQLKRLEMLDVELVQGFYFSKPLAKEDVLAVR